MIDWEGDKPDLISYTIIGAGIAVILLAVLGLLAQVVGLI